MRSRGQSGFTLFEIMIVFVIIGLVMVLAIPALDRASPKYALRAAAREVAGTINAARGLIPRPRRRSRKARVWPRKK